MLTEQFINLCGAIVFQNHAKFTSSTYDDIYHILHHYKEDTVPLDSRKKFKLVQTLIKLKISDKQPDEILDYVTATGQFNDLKDYLSTLSSRVISDEKIDGAIKNIIDRKKYCSILKDTPIIEEFIKKINSNSFSDLSIPIQQWENLVGQINTKISESKKVNTRAGITGIDLWLDSHEPILNQIEQDFCGSNSITSGYSQLDQYINGGFEPTRVYIFAGVSGGGKSVLLMNCAKNAGKRKKEPNSPREIFLYYTMENQPEESYLRLYSALFEKDYSDVIKEYSITKPRMEREFKNWEIQNNCSIVIQWFPGNLTTVADLLIDVEERKKLYANTGEVKAIYVDYLDLLKSNQSFEAYRMELGQITTDLKNAAVINRIPIITATQLNRGGYDEKAALSLSQIAESMAKVNNADFIALIRSISDENTNTESQINTSLGKLQLSIGKNRCGPKNKEVQFVTDFAKFLIRERARDEVPMMELPQSLPFQV